MQLLLALLLVAFGSIHIGYICGPSWPFEAGDPWLATALGIGSEAIRALGVALVLVAFFALLLAALAVAGLAVPARFRSTLVAAGAVDSAVALVLFLTPWSVPFLGIDAFLLWATFARGRRPTPSAGGRGHGSSHRQAATARRLPSTNQHRHPHSIATAGFIRQGAPRWSL